METASGYRSIHTTPSFAFQKGLGTTVRNDEISIPKLKRRSIQLTEKTEVVHAAIQPKKELPSYSGMNLDKPNPATDKMFSHLLVVWKSIRFLSSEDQIHPRFSGWIAATQLQQPESKKTTMTYLPPIPTPITEYDTIIEMFKVSRKLIKQSNMSYTHINLDAGAAIGCKHLAVSIIIIAASISMKRSRKC